MARSDRFPPSAGGFTYLWVLLAIGLVAAGLAATAEVASTAARRDKEAELLFAGDQFARAIARYRAAAPGSQVYPQRLEDLLADNRFPNVRRHLRRIYRDPMTGGADWGLIRGPNGGIVGVYSTSTAQPLKMANFPKDYAAFAGAQSYRDWVFAAGGPAGGAPGGAAGGGAVVGSRADGSSLGIGPSNPGTAPPQQAPAVRVPREPWACNAQRANDLRTCDGGAGPKGEEALEACRQSATRRFRDCLSGGQAEPLAVN